ncbi:MAG: single-stranded DNA-binding protein [bacterium]|nr:single-stranded DNA-binding protein [bacterium]
MAGTVNKVILIGRLGRDPELKYTANGAAVCTFTLATDESYVDRDENRQERTEWHNIVVYAKKAEIAHQYLKKGSQVFIEGRIHTREYVDRENVKQRRTEIICNDFTMLGGRPRDDGESASESNYGNVYGSKPQQGPSGPRPAGRDTGRTSPPSAPPPGVATGGNIDDDLPF